MEPPGDEVFVGPAGRRGSSDDRVTLRPTRHGVHASLTLDVASAAPFALQWWTRRVQVPFPAALHVSPRRGRPERPPTTPNAEAGEIADRPRNDVGFPRGARPYVPGDSRRLVHWRATAHTGHVMVRELERPSAGPVTVTVDLPVDPDEAEVVAERALGTVMDLLEAGAPVLLATVERSGPGARPWPTAERQVVAWRGRWQGARAGDSTAPGGPS